LWSDEPVKNSTLFYTLYSDYLTNYLTTYNINIPAFRKMKKDLNNPLHRWIIFFDNKSSDELINEVIEMDEDIKLADKKFNELLSDESIPRLSEDK
jgi:hypothetical protein